LTLPLQAGLFALFKGRLLLDVSLLKIVLALLELALALLDVSLLTLTLQIRLLSLLQITLLFLGVSLLASLFEAGLTLSRLDVGLLLSFQAALSLWHHLSLLSLNL
jgi:hypothetical protein